METNSVMPGVEGAVRAARLYAHGSNPPRCLLTFAERSALQRARVKARCAVDPEYRGKVAKKCSAYSLKRYYKIRADPDAYTEYRAKQRLSWGRWWQALKSDPMRLKRHNEAVQRARKKFHDNIRLIRAEQIIAEEKGGAKPTW